MTALPLFMTAFHPIYLTSVAKNILNPPSETYFREARGKAVGMDLNEFKQKNGERMRELKWSRT
jgi:hypothetical protein